MFTVIWVAAGGALGAVCRHGVNVAATHVAGHGFPWGTMAVNIAGSFLMGALIALLSWSQELMPMQMRPFLVTGFLGAFTTFSTFSLDLVSLWDRGEHWHAALYGGGSVVIALAALVGGMSLVRGLI